MTIDVNEEMGKAEEAFVRMDSFRIDADFRDQYEEKTSRFQAGLLEGLEALYRQNQVIIELLKGRTAR